MAAAQVTAVVKGDPKTNTLLDCPFCHRVLLTLETKKIPYANEYIDFDNKPQWLMDASGGKVPIIKVPSDNNLIMPDSDNIAVYLEEKFPQPSMASNVPPEVTSKLFGAFRGYLLSTPEEEADKKAAFLAELAALDTFLAGHQGPLFGGASMNSTDAAFAPKLYHAMVALPHFRGFKFEEPKFPALARYFAALQALPEWKRCDYGAAAIVKGWERHGVAVRK